MANPLSSLSGRAAGERRWYGDTIKIDGEKIYTTEKGGVII
jgi:hypothetical protein